MNMPLWESILHNVELRICHCSKLSDDAGNRDFRQIPRLLTALVVANDTNTY